MKRKVFVNIWDYLFGVLTGFMLGAGIVGFCYTSGIFLLP